jgi:hypothetical protein
MKWDHRGDLLQLQHMQISGGSFVVEDDEEDNADGHESALVAPADEAVMAVEEAKVNVDHHHHPSVVPKKQQQQRLESLLQNEMDQFTASTLLRPDAAELLRLFFFLLHFP